MEKIKEQVILMAYDLFSQYGIKSVSMDDIVRNMGISKRTLYGFFPDKETLLVEGIDYINSKHEKLIAELERGPYTVVDVILLFFEELMERPRWFSKKFYEDLIKFPKAIERKEMHKEKFEVVFTRLFNRGVKEGVFQGDVNFEIVVLLAKEQLKMKHPSKNFCKHSNTDVYTTVLVAFLRGICTDKGRLILDHWVKTKQLYSVQLGQPV